MYDQQVQVEREHIPDWSFSKKIRCLIAMTALACVLLGTDLDRAVANPVELTTAQMDRITAGAVDMTVVATGTASGGDGPRAGARSNVRTIDTPKVDVAIGRGHAYAIGEIHDVDLSASYTADGDKVINRTHSHEINAPGRSVGHLVSVVISRDK